MDNAQKAIMIGVGLFITIIIISAVLLIVNLGTGLVDDATDELDSMSTSLQNSILQSYDNKILSGVQVRSAIQQYLRSTDLTVVLCAINSTNKLAPSATVGAMNLDVTKLCDSSTNDPLYTVSSTSIDNMEGIEIATVDYKDATSNTKKQTTMSAFNDKSKAGTTYINTSSNYKSLILRIENTDTVVGIVFIPYDK